MASMSAALATFRLANIPCEVIPWRWAWNLVLQGLTIEQAVARETSSAGELPQLGLRLRYILRVGIHEGSVWNCCVLAKWVHGDGRGSSSSTQPFFLAIKPNQCKRNLLSAARPASGANLPGSPRRWTHQQHCCWHPRSPLERSPS